MFSIKNIFNLLLIIVFVTGVINSSDKKRIEIGIDEQLGSTIPLDLKFTDENGKEILLKDLVTIPTIFNFVYYSCPGICSPLLSEISNVAGKLDLIPGKDYQIISISIDETETSDLAADKKRNYLNAIKGDYPVSAWRFLTGDSLSIHTLTDAAGFYFKKDGDDFIHAGALIFVSPLGKITRYLFSNYSEAFGNFRILPFDVKMAVYEASEGRATPTIAKMLKFCFSYDREGKSYVLNITRIAGAGMLVLVAIFVAIITIKPRKRIEKN
jgi:protein SCO1